MYVSGSHRLRPRQNGDDVEFPSELMAGRIRQLTVDAGDAVIFPWCLWHGVAANRGEVPRESVIFRYGQLWMRGNDYDAMPPAVLSRMTARRRRLCGLINYQASPMDWYFPAEQRAVLDPRTDSP